MHEYYCKKCRGLFESSLSLSRCPTFTCQSRQIKDINVPLKGVTYGNFENCFEDEGEKCRRIMDKQGRETRQLIHKSIEEEQDNE